MQTWEQDAPTGVYKSHAMSQRLRESAIENTKFLDHVRPEPDYGKGRGETITLTRIAAVAEPTSAVLDEQTRIPEDDFTLSTTAITVSELGRSIPFTSLSTDLSEFDLNNPIQKKLREQLSLTLDTMAATAFKTTQIKYSVDGVSSSTVATSGTFGSTSAANMTVYHLEEIRDYMFDTLYVPPAEGDDYIGIFRTLGIRGIKRDPDWEEWHKYTDPASKFNSEVGRMENIRLIETNHADALGQVGTSSVLGEGVVFGDDACVVAEAMAPELRAEMNVGNDFGRSKAVAWYGILAFGLPFPTGNAGEAKILHVGSA